MSTIRRAILSLGLLATALTAPAAASNAVESPVPGTPAGGATTSFEETYAAKTAVTHDEFMRLIGAREADAADQPVTAAGVCGFAADGDYVHTSTYSGILYASGHGYWWNYTCPSSYRANVTIWLEEKLGTTWYPQGDSVTGFNRAPGSGSTQRVNAKIRCVNSTSHQWRSYVVVDIVGHSDTAPAATTAARTIACY